MVERYVVTCVAGKSNGSLHGCITSDVSVHALNIKSKTILALFTSVVSLFSSEGIFEMASST